MPRAGTVVRLLLLAGLLLFLALGQAPERTRLWTALFEAGHTPLFGAMALLLRGLLAARRPGTPFTRLSLQAFGLSLVLAVATEVMQLWLPNHDVSLHDVLRDAAGAAAFLLLHAAVAPRDASPTSGGPPGSSRPGGMARAAATLAASALLLAAGAELLSTTYLYIARARAFPTLAGFDGSWWERQLISTGDNRLTPGQAPPGLPAPRVPLARFDLRPGRYSGYTLDEPYPDWRGYRQLAFTIVSDLEAPLPLVIRIHDAAHDQRYADRFNRRILVQPGINHVVIPLEDVRRAPDRRRMDLAHVRGIVVFAYELRSATHLFLGPLRLE